MMKTKKLSVMAIVVAIVFVLGLVIAFTTSAQPPATGSFVDSVNYSDGKVSFLIPNGAAGWDIHIAGRVEIEGFGGMSVHYLEDTDWESGKAYAFDVSGGNYTELSLTASRDGEDLWIDIMGYLPEHLKTAS